MATRSLIDRLKQIAPRSGRAIGAGGALLNTADSPGLCPNALARSGRLFTAGGVVASVAAGGSYSITIVGPAGGARVGVIEDVFHMPGGPWRVDVTEGGTVSGGTAIAEVGNVDRNAPAFGGSVLADATVTGGTNLPPSQGQAGDKKTASGVTSGGVWPLILPAGGNITFKVTNNNGSPQWLDWSILFYEGIGPRDDYTPEA